MSAKVWIDGKFFDKYDAKISVFDHGLLFGDGVWIGTRIFNGRAFRLDEYLDQLRDAADAIGLKLPLSQSELAAAVGAAITANTRTEGYVRVTVTRGAGTLGLDTRKCEPCVVIVAEDVMPFPREVYAAGIDVLTVTGATENTAWTLSQVDATTAKAKALRSGCFEAILLHPDETVIRPTDGELFLVHGGVLIHSASFGMADRVLWSLVREIAGGLKIRANETRLSKADLTQADELFIVSSSSGVIAVRSVDGQPVGSGGEGPVTKRLREAFHRATRGSVESPIIQRDEPPASQPD